MMIKQTLSFGIVMAIENGVTLLLMLDLLRRVILKARMIRHPHVYWKSGIVLMGYLMCSIVYVIAQTYLGWVNYVPENKEIEFSTVVIRGFSVFIFMIGKIMLWYYTVNWGFNLFQKRE